MMDMNELQFNVQRVYIVAAKIQFYFRVLIHSSAKVQIDYRLGYAYTHTRAGHSKLPVDPGSTRSL